MSAPGGRPVGSAVMGMIFLAVDLDSDTWNF